MTVDSAIRSFIAAAAFTLTVCNQVYALTVYDVIQLSSKDYSNQDIEALIEVTNSEFALTAKDVPRLMDLGVSETVIQAMLKATHLEAATDSPTDPGQQEPNAPATTGQDDTTGGTAKPAGAAPAYIASNRAIARKGFGAEPFEETAADGHRHSIITLSGMQLFVLRDDGQYPSVAARASTVVERLEEAASFGSGTFQPVHIAGKDAVMFSERDGVRAVVIVSVSENDAYTYKRRSGRRVTPELLAAYWSALLSDYWSIAIADEPPEKLTSLHEGEALQALYNRLAASGENDHSKQAGTLQSLPHQEREHLLRLATEVPHDFNTRSPPVAEHP